MKDSELLELELDEAQRRKWAFGREKYGDAWAGERPMVQAFGEVVDLLNYIDEDHVQGFTNEEQCRALRVEVVRVAEAVRLLCRPPGTPL